MCRLLKVSLKSSVQHFSDPSFFVHFLMIWVHNLETAITCDLKTSRKVIGGSTIYPQFLLPSGRTFLYTWSTIIARHATLDKHLHPSNRRDSRDREIFSLSQVITQKQQNDRRKAFEAFAVILIDGHFFTDLANNNISNFGNSFSPIIPRALGHPNWRSHLLPQWKVSTIAHLFCTLLLYTT